MSLRSLLDRLNHSDIGDGNGSVFFRRYDVLKTRWFAVYLHQFFRSDHDRCLHDHPWPFATLILRGGYWEIIPDSWQCAGAVGLPCHDADLCHAWPSGRRRLWRRPGYFGRYGARHAHRIEIDPDTRPWSLVVVGKKVRPWGFWGPSGWIKWAAGQPNPICDTEGRTT